MHDPPDPLRIHPHPKGHRCHHHLDLASTEGQLNLLSVLQSGHVAVSQSCSGNIVVHVLYDIMTVQGQCGYACVL